MLQLKPVIPAREKASTQPVTVHPLPEAVHCAIVLERDGYVQVTVVFLIWHNRDIAFDNLKKKSSATLIKL